jgi:hypothetical protein
MLTVVCWKWFDPNGRHNHLFVYGPDYVNILRNMLERHLTIPHRLICVTDDPEGIDPRVKIVDMPVEVEDWPGMFQRLILFRPDAEKVFGKRILAMDLDVVIKANIDGLVSREEDFAMWEPRLFHVKKGKYSRYNGSMILMDAGCRPEVWTEFSVREARRRLTAAGLDVDDQSWISHVLGPDEAIWPWDGEIRSLKATPDPEKARIVFFNGPRSPAMPELQRQYPFIAEHWR